MPAKTPLLRPIAALTLALQLCTPLPQALAQAPAPVPAHQQDESRESLGEWSNMGTLELRLPDRTARFTWYRNGDFLAEREYDEHVRRLLIRAKPSSTLYFGLSESELEFDRNPFEGMTKAFTFPLMALRQAFPDGPSSLGPTPAKQRITLWGAEMEISAWSLPGARVGYQIELPVADAPRITGEFSATQPEPLREDGVASWGPPQQMRRPKAVPLP